MIQPISYEDDPGSAPVGLPDTELTAEWDGGLGVDGSSLAHLKRERKPPRHLQDFIVSRVQQCKLASHVNAQAADEESVKQTP